MVVRRGYKQTEVGVIPEDWEVDALGRFWNVTDCKHVTAKFIASGYPVASIKEVQSRFVDLTNAKQTTQTFYDLLTEGGRKPRVGDLILSRNATVGEVAQVANWHPLFAIGQDVCLLQRKSPDSSSAFLQAVFRSGIIGNQLSGLMVGSTFKRANVRQIKSFTVPMPGPTEQEAIAEALSDADALIESLEQLLAKKRRIKQGAMQELLTGKRRLPGFGSQLGYTQTEVGIIPKDWELQPIGSLCEIVAGRDLVKTDFSPTDNPRHPFPIYSNALTSKGLYGFSESYQYEGNRLTVTARGDIGHAVYRSTKFCAIGRLLVLASKRECDLRFITEFINNVVDFALESTGVPQLTAPQISKYTVALPPTKAEQEAIATVLADMDAEITALEAKLSKARQLKQGMMQELLTGRIRLV